MSVCFDFDFRLKCTKSKQITVEELYLDLEDLKQSKSNWWGEGGGSHSLHKEPIRCISDFVAVLCE